MRFNNERELFQFIDDAVQSTMDLRQRLANRMGIDRCYYEGVQWLSASRGPVRQFETDGTVRYNTNYNPQQQLRVTTNETSKYVIKNISATYPEQMYIEANPPERDTGPEASHGAHICEVATNKAIDEAKYIEAWRAANARRCINGTWGVGLSIESVTRSVRGEGRPARYVCAFDFDPVNLVLDPSCQNIHLHEHPHVGFVDSWTVDRIRRVYGVKLDPERLRTMEQLEAAKIEMNRLSSDRLFSNYANYSKAKAARVHQWHFRDDTGRFSEWYVVIEDADGKRHLVNADQTETPFGGSGLPFVLLHAYLRSDSMWSWGDVAQIKDEQDKMNLGETLWWKIVQKYGGTQWLVDRRAFGARATNEEVRKHFTNQPYGVIQFDGADRNRNVQAPQLVQQPPPPAFVRETIQEISTRMREKSHRSGAHFGDQPTHVPFKTTQRVLDEADAVLAMRVSTDVRAHEYLTTVLLGTVIKHGQEDDPQTLRMLYDAGFDEMDFGALLSMDPQSPAVTIKVREGSVRMRSYAQKKQDLDTAMQLQVIDGYTYQKTMADFMDAPLSGEWRQMSSEAKKQALRVLNGEEWVARPLGQWNKLFIEEFQRATLSKRAKADPAAVQRLVRAVAGQYQMVYDEAVMADPTLAAKMTPAAGPETGAAPQEPQAGAAVSVADLLDSLAQGGPATGQPEPALN